MTDLGTLPVDLPGGPVVFGWWLAEHPGIAVLALAVAWLAVALLAGHVVVALGRGLTEL
jgi:hypothetical protein